MTPFPPVRAVGHLAWKARAGLPELAVFPAGWTYGLSLLLLLGYPVLFLRVYRARREWHAGNLDG